MGAASIKMIGLAGLGYWGKNIFRNLSEMGVLYAACDADLSVLNSFKQKKPDIHYTSSYDELLEDGNVKAVALSTSAATHHELVKRALEAGKDVFVEKPLALKVDEGEELRDLAGARGRVLMVGHLLQYHPAVIRLKELVSTGELGKIQYIYSNRLNIGKLRTEENILWSFAPHDISVILGLLDEEPASVRAMGGDYLNKGVADTTMTTMEFSNGVRGHIFVSWLHPFKEQKLIVVGSSAMAVFDDISSEKLVIYAHGIEWRDGRIPVAQKAEGRVIPIDTGEPLRMELDHFLECVNERKQPRTDVNEGLRVLKVLDAAQQSLNYSRRAVIQTDGAVGPGRVDPDKGADVFIHDSALVDDGARIGENTRIWHFTHVLAGSRIGSGCTIGQNCVIGPDVTIGDNCKIQNNVSVYKGVTLEDGVFCGPACVFTNVYTPRAFIERKDEFKPTLVKKGASIGANASIVCNTTIGAYAMVGAGAVVKSDVKDHAIVSGVPAKQTGWACKCGVTLEFNDCLGLCKRCGNKYEVVGDSIKSVEESDLNSKT